MKSLGFVESDFLKGKQIPDELLLKLPKVDLHVHLDGSLRFETFVALSKDEGVELPGGSEEAAREMLCGPACKNLADYISLFDLTVKVMQTKEALRRVTLEAIEDCAAENVWRVELRFSPSLHCEKGLSLEDATDAVLEGCREGVEKTGISVGLLIAGVRHRGPEETLKLAKLTVAYKGRGVCGFDLAGVEAENPAKAHTEAFYEILNNNINCSVHAGEAWGPDSIHQALHYLGAHRLGHATRLLEDRDLAGYVASHRIPVEVGLSSSLRTGAIAEIADHPLRRFMRKGIRVTLSTNNRLFLQTSLCRELRLAVDCFDLNLLELENLLLSGFKSSFLPQSLRVDMIRKAVDSFGKAREECNLERSE